MSFEYLERKKKMEDFKTFAIRTLWITCLIMVVVLEVAVVAGKN